MERARVRLLTPLRQRDFRLLWAGMTVSLLGDGIFLVAMPWQVYQLSDAPTALAFVGIAMSVPNIVLLLAGGVVSDRFDRRKVMMVADLMRGLSVGAFGLLSLSGALELWHVMIIAAVFGAGTAFFGPAFDAIVPQLVPAEHLTQANALDQFVRPAAWRMLGPALGGWIIASFHDQAGAAFLIDAATFAVSVSCLLLMHARPSARDRDEETSAWGEVKEGFRYVRSQTWLWGTLLAAALAYLVFLGPTEVLLPWVVKNDMHEGANDLGMILALGGVGSMAAAVFMGRRQLPRRNMTFIYTVWTLSTLCLAGYGLARFPWQAMAACLAFNALESAGTIVWITTKQQLVPNRLLGRVSSLDWFISIGLLPVSLALTPIVAGVIGARSTLIWAGVAGAAITFAFLFLPGLRDVERRRAVRVESPTATDEPRPTGIAPTGAAGNGDRAARVVPTDDHVVYQHLQTLANLRRAIERFQASQVELFAELEVLEAEEARLVQADRILDRARAATAALESIDLMPLRTVADELSGAADVDPRSASLAGRTRDILAAADEIIQDVRRHWANAELDPTRLEHVRARLRALRQLQQDYDDVGDQIRPEDRLAAPGALGAEPELG